MASVLFLELEASRTLNISLGWKIYSKSSLVLMFRVMEILYDNLHIVDTNNRMMTCLFLGIKLCADPLAFGFRSYPDYADMLF